MKTTLKLLMVLVLALATFMQHSSASAATTIKFQGASSTAVFSSTDGCIATDVFVFASEGAFKSPPGKGPLVSISRVEIFISQYNFCTNTLLISANGDAQLSEEAFQVSKKLDQATLNTSVNVINNASDPPTSFDVFIDLTWTGTGPLSNQKFNSHFKTPGCKIHSRFRGESRFAEASGTVSNGTINFTPEPSVEAFLTLAKSGDVVIGCN